jgi:6-pyruvoyltetrahydropterin/6-carboxytetrahydropterin synthase
MFTLRKIFHFEAAHQLKQYNGKCSRLHGHSWEMVVEITGEIITDEKNYIMIDYDDISRTVKPLIEEKFDHYYLNETLNTDKPSSEFIAKWLFDYLKHKFDSPYYKLNAIEISETCTSFCRYEGDN